MQKFKSSRPRAAVYSTSRSNTSSTMCSRSVRTRLTVLSTAVNRSHNSAKPPCSEALAQLANAVDLLVVAVKEATDQLGWFVISCSPCLAGANTSNSLGNPKERCSNNASVSVSTTLKKNSTEGSSCRVAELIPPQRSPCSLVC